MDLKKENEKRSKEKYVFIHNKKKVVPQAYLKHSSILSLLVHDFEEPTVTPQKEEKQALYSMIDPKYKNFRLAKKLIDLDYSMKLEDEKNKKKARKTLQRMLEQQPEKVLMTAAYWGIKIHEKMVDFASAKPYYGLKLTKSMDRWLAHRLIQNNNKVANHIANYALCHENFTEKECDRQPAWFYKSHNQKSLTINCSELAYKLKIVPGGVRFSFIEDTLEEQFFLNKPFIESLCKNASGSKIGLVGASWCSVLDTANIPWQEIDIPLFDFGTTCVALMNRQNKIALIFVNNKFITYDMGTKNYIVQELFPGQVDHLFTAPTVCSLVFTPDDCRFAALFTDDTIGIYATDPMEILKKIECKTPFIKQLCFSDDGQSLGYVVGQSPNEVYGTIEPKRKLFNHVYRQMHQLTFDQAQFATDAYKIFKQRGGLVITKKDKRHPVFLGMPQPLIKILAQSCKIKTFYKQDIVLLYGFAAIICLYYLWGAYTT